MYLSRIRLNVEKRNTQLALSSPNKFHGAVESCFETAGERRLWRLDQLAGAYYLLLLSPEKPVLNAMKAQFGYPEEPDEIKDYDGLLRRIESGSVWQFRLAANPVHSVKKDGHDRGKVVAHVSEKYQMEWLRKKAAANGFAILTDGSCVVRSDWKIFRKKNRRQSVRIKATVFEGYLRVDDAELFRQALTRGIGRGKAYGMGLLTIMKA